MKDRSREGLIPVLMLCVIFVLLVCYVVEWPEPVSAFREESKKVKILLDHDRILADHNDAFRVEDSRLTIVKGGEYTLIGDLADGQIIVDAGPEEDVTLKLDNVTIHCEDSAPIFIKGADSVTIKLKKNSKNHISDGKAYAPVEEGAIQPKGCIYAKTDLKIKGAEGELYVEGNYKHGIASSDDLKIKSGKLVITARNTALRGKDSVTVEDGTLTLTGRDGIFSNGNVDLRLGSIRIDAKEYGVFGRMGIHASEACDLNILHAASPMAEPEKTE